MLNLNRYMLLPPFANWEEFEDFCLDLWKKTWNDPNAQKNGRKGQPQKGVDIFGSPNGEGATEGVQCKGKDNYSDARLTRKEIDDEVEKAKKFRPALRVFTIATTAKPDEEIQEYARLMSDKHREAGLFLVVVKSWNDILADLGNYPGLLKKHYPGFTLTSEKAIAVISLEGDEPIARHDFGLHVDVSAGDASPGVTIEHQAEIDHSRELLKSNKAVEAYDYLDKLKKRIWNTAAPIVKFRILTNIGSAKLAMNDEIGAGKLFLEARQYNSEEEKAIANSALGYLLLGQLKEAKEEANKAILLNPANTQALLTRVRAMAQENDLEALILSVPEIYRDSSDMAYTFYWVSREKGRQVDALKWIRIAEEKDKDDSPELKAAFATCLIEPIQNDNVSVLFGLPNESQKQNLNIAIELLESAWKSYDLTETKRYRTDWLLNLSIAKNVIGDTNGAIRANDLALELQPDIPGYKANRAVLALKAKDYKLATTLARNLVGSLEVPAAVLLLAESLVNDGKINEAISTLETFISKEDVSQIRERAQVLLAQILFNSEQADKALQVVDDLLTTNPESMLAMVFKSRILLELATSEASDDLLKEAMGLIVADTSKQALLLLAEALFENNLLAESCQVYERFVDTNVASRFSQRLLEAYYKIGDYKKALELCRKIHEGNEPVRFVSEVEAFILENIGDLTSAEDVLVRYVDKNPDDDDILLRLAAVRYRLGKTGDLDVFMKPKSQERILSLPSRLNLAAMLCGNRQFDAALELAYETRRAFFNQAEAHDAYVHIFLEIEKPLAKLIDPKKVEAAVAVFLNDSSGSSCIYHLTTEDTSNLERGEIGTSHPLYKQLLGKKVGSKISIDQHYQSKEMTISMIQSEYVFAFQETVKRYEELFPLGQAIRGVSVDTDALDKDGLPKGLDVVLKNITQQSEHVQRMKDKYGIGNLTLGALSNTIGFSLLDTIYGITGDSTLGIRAAVGNVEELALTMKLTSKTRLVTDLVSIVTLHSIGLGKSVVGQYGKLIVAQSVIDEVHLAISRCSSDIARGQRITIGKEKDEYIQAVTDKDSLKKNLKDLKQLLGWIKRYCEVAPVKAALDMLSSEKSNLEKALGRSSTDCVLLASESGRILYSDDEVLRRIAGSGPKIRSVWTQAILMQLLNNGVISAVSYQEALIKLIELGHHHIFINDDTLLVATMKAKYVSKAPFLGVLDALTKEDITTISLVNVLGGYFYKLFRVELPELNRKELIKSALAEIRNRPDYGIIMYGLTGKLSTRFINDILLVNEIVKQIDVALEELRYGYLLAQTPLDS